MLVAAMNPTPTGSKNGRSTVVGTQRYLNKISGPRLDRIDIHVGVPAVKHETLLKSANAEPSSAIRERRGQPWCGKLSGCGRRRGR
jgi:magnesium chelatase family protein